MNCHDIIQPFNAPQTILYWFGDSITMHGAPASPSYADMLNDTTLFPQWSGHEHINAAVGGGTFEPQEAVFSSSWASHLDAAMVNGKTVLVTYAIGGNDMTNSKPAEALFNQIASHSANLKSRGIKTVCTTVLPRTYAEGAQVFQAFNEMVIRSQNVFDRVVDFSVVADDPFDATMYPDGTHPSTTLHYQIAKAWDIGVRIGLQPASRLHYIRTTSDSDVGLKISGKAGGQSAHLQDWEIGNSPGPASYVDGLGNFFVRSLAITFPNLGISWPGGGTVGPLAAMPHSGTGFFCDNISAAIVLKTSGTQQWSILNTGDLVPLNPNDIGSIAQPVQAVHAETVLAGGNNLGQVISDLQARVAVLEQG